MLMTRGSLTTFCIANDVAKYFAIIPAAFVATYPQLGALNVMGLASPASAILSAVIFNALIIVFLIPLALKGVQLPPVGRRRAAAAQSADLRPRRRDRAVHRHQGDRPVLVGRSAWLEGVTDDYRYIRPALVLFVVLTLLTGVAYPLLVTGIAQLAFPDQADGSLREATASRRLAR